MRIKNFWYWCNTCQVRFPVPVKDHPAGWPIHPACGLDNVSEDDIRFVTLDKRLAARLEVPS